ncbi:MAG TPA: hypothetical protein VFJ14_06850 [Nocardioidaceae bacterium]|nr:hypothetical protein [Nocardioidaceae bacterium]
MSALAWFAVAGWWAALCMTFLWFVLGAANDAHRKQRDGYRLMHQQACQELRVAQSRFVALQTLLAVNGVTVTYTGEELDDLAAIEDYANRGQS